jgi:UDP-2-acetamido-3-amino-2,3-dideoxy-glucuronate N-acetyltransferase
MRRRYGRSRPGISRNVTIPYAEPRSLTVTPGGEESRPGPAPFVHPAALCEAEVGPGTRVWAFAHVMAGASVGADCNICDHVFVEAGAVIGDRVVVKNGVSVWDRVRIEDDVFVGPNVAFTNDRTPRARGLGYLSPLVGTDVRRGATIGANATIVCGVEIGEFALVGAGAVVVKDVAPYALVVGNPARVVGTVCRCGRRRGRRPCACGEDSVPPAA